MNRISIIKKRGERVRKQQATCPQCKEEFVSRKDRMLHQRHVHRAPKPVARYS